MGRLKSIDEQWDADKTAHQFLVALAKLNVGERYVSLTRAMVWVNSFWLS